MVRSFFELLSHRYILGDGDYIRRVFGVSEKRQQRLLQLYAERKRAQMIFKSNAKPKVPSVVPHDQALIDAWVYERFDLFVHKVTAVFLQVISEGNQEKV